MDEILAYMFMMLHEATYKGISIKRESFVNHGKKIPLFPGVEYWFDRINDYAAERNVKIKHYIISSGLREMIEGTSIHSKFAHVYASGYMYNQDNIAVWPATAVNYTNKTQNLFRINKGIENSWDNESVNKFILEDERPIPSTNIIYIGDGETDVPAMKMTKYLNGKAIAVYDPNKPGMKKASDERVLQNRADFSLATDYREGKELDLTIKSIIDEISSRH